jgi:hypothetical protein
MRRYNPRQVFPINTCSRHGTSNDEQPQASNASKFLRPSLLHHYGYFTPFVDVHMRLRDPIYGTVILSDPALRESE